MKNAAAIIPTIAHFRPTCFSPHNVINEALGFSTTQPCKVADRLIRLIYAAIFVLSYLITGAIMGMTPTAQAAACSGSGITGTVFRDYNANGAQDANEPGIAGIVVTAYDSGGASVSCESTATGAYGLDPAGAYPVRLEFTLPADGSLNFLKPGAAGSSSHTTVTFVNGPTANINTGFSSPADFCGATPAPALATSCFVFGEQNDNADGVNKDQTVLYTFPYGAGSTDLTNEAQVRTPLPTTLAQAKQIGSVWGLAWNPQRQTLYAAAFLKRHTGFGPNGPGAIYQITAAGPTLFYDIGAQAGSDPHAAPGQTCPSNPGPNTNTNFACWFHDSTAFDLVGKVGFGDLDIAEDFSTLYTINLATNQLLAIPVTNPAANTAVAVPTPSNCPAIDVRPFALAIKDGKVYVGMVCTAESTQNRAQLRAYVYAFANGVFATTPALEIDLTTFRTSGNIQWQYWLNRTTFNPTNVNQSSGKWAQPWLTDIVFDGNDLVLGFRDRDADQFGTVAGGPTPTDPNRYSAIARGDILRACADGTGGWQLESKGACGGVTTAGATNHPEGPGGGEYYYQDEQVAQPHSETSMGALVQVPGQPDVLSTIFNPIELPGAVSDNGVKWYNNRSGATVRGYLVNDRTANPALFGKANGLGDLEALCPAAPLEIGNRVWRDSDGDGVQDPNEPGLDGVTVELYRDGVLAGVTTTANNGQYLFNDSNVTLNGAGGIVAGLCGPNGEAVYEIRIPNAGGSSQQPPLLGLTLTQANNGGATDGAIRDSNGALAGVNALYAVPCSDLSAPGFNNHTYDFGFSPAAVPTELVALGNLVFRDVNNDGRIDSNEAGIDGVTVALFPADADPLTAVPLATTTTSGGGFYLFDNLTPGQYFAYIQAQNFQTGAVLAGYRSSTGSGTSDSADDNVDENGIDTPNLATNGLRSIVYDLQPNSEPTAEAGVGRYGGLLDDDNVNLTADFGVYVPLSLGNRVWLDDGAGGGVANNGLMDGNEQGIANVVVRLLTGAGQPVTDATGQPMVTTTDEQGYYFFNDLLPGAYVVLIDASNFAPGGALQDLNNSDPTETTPDNDGDLNDNGLNVSNPAATGIRSGVVTLAYNAEPINEVDLGPLGADQEADTNNLTIDFGFYKAPTAIEEQPEPTGNQTLYLPMIRR